MYFNCIGSQGVEIVATPDQNHTDFTKAIMEVSKRTQDMQVYDAMPIALYVTCIYWCSSFFEQVI